MVGGGDSGTAPQPSPTLEGLWTNSITMNGVTSTGYLLVEPTSGSETQNTWSIATGANAVIVSVGNVKTTGDTFKNEAIINGYVSSNQTVFQEQGTFTGKFLEQQSINGHANIPGLGLGLDYNSSLKYAKGNIFPTTKKTYIGQDGNGNPGTVTVDNVSVEGTIGNCLVTGALTHSYKADNYVSVNVKFDGDECVYKGKTLPGVALINVNNTSVTVILKYTHDDKSYEPLVFIGQ